MRDVRAFGGILAPTIDVVLHAQLATARLELAKPGILLSDVVDSKLASPLGSVFLRNSGEEDIEILDIQASGVRIPISLRALASQIVLAQDSRALTAGQTNRTSSPRNVFGTVIIAAGQTRPATFNVSLPAHNVSSIHYSVVFKTTDSSQVSRLDVSQNLIRTSVYEPHKITYLHPGGMVSYAMLRPPARNATCAPGQRLPVLLDLHGAGLEADNGIVAHALDPVPDLCAWVMFPTGVTPWSGDDWRECNARLTDRGLM